MGLAGRQWQAHQHRRCRRCSGFRRFVGRRTLRGFRRVRRGRSRWFARSSGYGRRRRHFGSRHRSRWWVRRCRGRWWARCRCARASSERRALPWLPVDGGVVAGAVLGVDNGRCSVAIGGMDSMAGGVDPWLAVGDGVVEGAERADAPFGESPVEEPREGDAPNVAGEVFPPADDWPKWITARPSATSITTASGIAIGQRRCPGLGTGVPSMGLSTGLSSEPKYHEPSSPRYCDRPWSSWRRPTDPIRRTLFPQLPLSLSSICGGDVIHFVESRRWRLPADGSAPVCVHGTQWKCARSDREPPR